MRKANLAVLASGSGSNLEALINAVNNGIISNARIALVLSNKKDAYALARAKNVEVPAFYVKRSEFENDESFDEYLVLKLREFEIDVVLLAGYLRILTAPLLKIYAGRILNIHPSLLPEFGGIGMYGMKIHEEVIKSGVSTSGCSVHIVNEQVDGGHVLARASVPVTDGDTAQNLAARVLKEEHILYPETVGQFIAGLEL